MTLALGIIDIVLSVMMLYTAVFASDRGDKWWARAFLIYAFGLAVLGTYLVAKVILR